MMDLDVPPFALPMMTKRKRTFKTKKPAAKRQRFEGPRKRFVPRAVGAQLFETHYFDSQLAATTLSTTATSWAGTEVDPATLNCLFAPITGADITGRFGRSCTMKSIRINGIITMVNQNAQTLVDPGLKVRVILYMDKNTNAAFSQGEDVINSGTATLASMMFQNTTNFGKFQVLKDKSYHIYPECATGPTPAIEQGGQTHQLKMTYKWPKGCVVHFNNTAGGTVADIIDNSLHLIAIADSAAFITQIQYKSRVAFIP